MPAAIAIPLITAGVSAGTSIVGAKMASNASKDAAKIQDRGARDAAAATQRVTDQTLQYLHGAQGASRQPMGGATSALSQAMGFAPMQPSPMKRSPFTFGPGQMPVSGPGMGGPHPGEVAPAPQQMVLMIAPTGEQQQVPASQVKHFEARGARRAS